VKPAGLLRIPLYVLYLLLIAEIGCRAFWRIEYEVPLFEATRQEWHGVFFKGFRPGAEPAPLEDPRSLDVLLLGGSVLYGLWKHTGEEFTERLAAATGRPVRIVNHAKSGHTTRDSVLKYRMLEDRRFDLVIFYHGINDTRLNEVPEGMFLDDYTHFVWYEQISLLDEMRPWNAISVIPFSVAYTWLDWSERWFFARFFPRFGHNPPATARDGEIRTEATFRANLDEVLETAGERGETVLLMTFAWHVPEGYTLERFKAGALDYGEHRTPVEVWGKPDQVIREMRAHNDLIAEYQRAGVIFVDAEAAMPRDGETFDDVCHFSKAGESRWMDLFIPAIVAGMPAP
jgi:hypothetical protein